MQGAEMRNSREREREREREEMSRFVSPSLPCVELASWMGMFHLWGGGGIEDVVHPSMNWTYVPLITHVHLMTMILAQYRRTIW
jgi:hypothetical protein